MFKKLFVIAFFSGFLGNAYSQKIDNILEYRSDIIKKIPCPDIIEGQRIIVKDMFNRDANVLCGCAGPNVVLENIIVNDATGKIILEVAEDYILSDKDEFLGYEIKEANYTYYDNGKIKNFSEYTVDTDNQGSEITSTMESLANYTPDSRILNTFFSYGERTSEQLWEYSANGSKCTLNIINGKDDYDYREQHVYEYNKAQQLIRETDSSFDISNAPKGKVVIEPVLGTKKIHVTVYKYENGVERIEKTEEASVN